MGKEFESITDPRVRQVLTKKYKDEKAFRQQRAAELIKVKDPEKKRYCDAICEDVGARIEGVKDKGELTIAVKVQTKERGAVTRESVIEPDVFTTKKAIKEKSSPQDSYVNTSCGLMQWALGYGVLTHLLKGPIGDLVYGTTLCINITVKARGIVVYETQEGYYMCSSTMEEVADMMRATPLNVEVPLRAACSMGNLSTVAGSGAIGRPKGRVYLSQSVSGVKIYRSYSEGLNLVPGETRPVPGLSGDTSGDSDDRVKPSAVQTKEGTLFGRSGVKNTLHRSTLNVNKEESKIDPGEEDTHALEQRQIPKEGVRAAEAGRSQRRLSRLESCATRIGMGMSSWTSLGNVSEDGASCERVRNRSRSSLKGWEESIALHKAQSMSAGLADFDEELICGAAEKLNIDSISPANNQALTAPTKVDETTAPSDSVLSSPSVSANSTAVGLDGARTTS